MVVGLKCRGPGLERGIRGAKFVGKGLLAGGEKDLVVLQFGLGLIDLAAGGGEVVLATIEGLAALFESLGALVEFAGMGIRVNCIMPGNIDSPPIYKEILPLYNGDIDRMRKERGERVPLRHMGEPWDVALAALFLVSDEIR